VADEPTTPIEAAAAAVRDRWVEFAALLVDVGADHDGRLAAAEEALLSHDARLVALADRVDALAAAVAAALDALALIANAAATANPPADAPAPSPDEDLV
jgi:hypothetical protein